jgi:hypothetical protein
MTGTKKLPEIKGDKGQWGEILNEYLLQISPKTKGGLNFESAEPSLSPRTNNELGLDDEGYTYINSSTNMIRRWNGSKFVTILEGITGSNGISKNNLFQYRDDNLISKTIVGSDTIFTFQNSQKIRQISGNGVNAYAVDPLNDGNSIIEVKTTGLTTITLPNIIDWKKTYDNLNTDGAGTLLSNRSREITIICKSLGNVKIVGPIGFTNYLELSKDELVTLYSNSDGTYWEIKNEIKNSIISNQGITLSATIPISKNLSFSVIGLDYYQHGAVLGVPVVTIPAIPRVARPGYQWVLDFQFGVTFSITDLPLNGVNIVELTSNGNNPYLNANNQFNPNFFGQRQSFTTIAASTKSTSIVSGQIRITEASTPNIYGLSPVGQVTQINAKFFTAFSHGSTVGSTSSAISNSGSSIIDGGYTIPRGNMSGEIANFSYYYDLKEQKIIF